MLRGFRTGGVSYPDWRGGYLEWAFSGTWVQTCPSHSTWPAEESFRRLAEEVEAAYGKHRMIPPRDVLRADGR